MAGDDWSINLNMDISWLVRDAANRGAAIAAEHVLGEAIKTIPIEEGTLKRSGFTATDPKNLRAAVSFDTPYAVRVHEDMTARHDEGRTAKFLENALNSETEAVKKIIAMTIRGEL
jgi:hypothetical protein